MSKTIKHLLPTQKKIFLTEKWMPMVSVLQILALFGFIRSLGAINSMLLRGLKKPQTTTQWELIRLLIFLVLISPLTFKFGVEGTAIAVLLSTLIFTIGLSLAAIKIIDCNKKRFSSIVGLPFIAGLIMLLCITGIKTTIITIQIWHLFLLIITGILIYFGLIYLFDKFLNFKTYPLIKKSLILFKQ